MVGRHGIIASVLILVLLLPIATSSFNMERGRGGYDADGVWTESVELALHHQWWLDWSRDADHDFVDDRIEWLLEQPVDVQQDWWRKAGPEHARIFIDYDHQPTDADVEALTKLGVEVTLRAHYLDTVAATVPLELLQDPATLLSLSGLVMIEDLGLAEPHMNEAVPTMGVDDVWNDFGFIGTGVTIAILDTGIRGDHEGLNDLDDDRFTCIDDPPDLSTRILTRFRLIATPRSRHSTTPSTPTPNNLLRTPSTLGHMGLMSLESLPAPAAARRRLTVHDTSVPPPAPG